MLLEETPAVLSLVKLCEDHGFSYHWTSGQNPHLIKKGKRIDCNTSNCAPFVVPGLSASSSSTSSSPASSTSSQDSVFDVNRYTENPVPERSVSTSGELWGDPLHHTTETENENKNGESEEVQRGISDELHDWLREFRETLVGLGKPRARKSRHFQVISWTSNGSALKSGTGFGFAQCTRTFRRTQIVVSAWRRNNKGFLQKTCWYSRAQSGKFGWFHNCGSQSSQRRKWIAEQWSICWCGSRIGNALVTILLL